MEKLPGKSVQLVEQNNSSSRGPSPSRLPANNTTATSIILSQENLNG